MPKKILTIDENKQTTRLIQVNLERAGFKVVVHNPPENPDFDQIMKIILEEKPDLIVTEQFSAKRTVNWGPELIKALRANPTTNEIPIIVLFQTDKESQHTDAEVFSMWQCEAECVLTKPFNPLELLTYVRRIFESLEDREEDDA